MQLPLSVWLLLCTFAHHALASVELFKNGEQIGNYSTFDFFQYNSPHFEVEGVPIEMVLNNPEKGKKCILSSVLPEVSKTNITIMWVALSDDNRCMVDTISSNFKYAQEFEKLLESNGFTKPNTLVVVRAMEHPGAPTVDYKGLGDYDGPPSADLNFQLLDIHPAKYYDALGTLRNQTDRIRVIQEPGNWNKVYNSVFFEVARGLIFSAALIALIVSLHAFVTAYYQNDIHFDLRNSIFVSSLIATCLTLIQIWMPIYIFSRSIIEIFSTTICAVAFHMLLFLWTVFLISFGQQQSLVLAFRVIIFTSLTIALVFFASNLTYKLTPSSPGMEAYMAIYTGWVLMFSQITIASLFIFFSVYFLLTRKTVKGFSAATVEALTKLSLLGILASFTYLMLALINSSLFLAIQQQNVVANMVVYWVKIFAVLLRASSLMFVLGIKASSSSSGSGQTSSVGTASTATAVGSGNQDMPSRRKKKGSDSDDDEK